MPELPEVEAARRAIEDHCIGKKIKKSSIADDSKVIEGVSPRDFEASLNGKTILAALRKGKNMWLQLDSPPFPTFQFGMAGAVYIKGVAVTKYKRSAVNDTDDWPSKYSKFLIELEDGMELSFTDKRRFAKVRLLENPAAVPPISELGPDALLEPMTVDEFNDALSRKKIGIKAILLDQSFISGIGNWIADEVLYQARIHPLQIASSMSKESCGILLKCINEVIQFAVEVDADCNRFPDAWLFHFRWGKKPGKVNGKKIDFIKAGGRTTAYVPELQKLSGSQTAKAASKTRKNNVQKVKDSDGDEDDDDSRSEEEASNRNPKVVAGRKSTRGKKHSAKRNSKGSDNDSSNDDDDEDGGGNGDEYLKKSGAIKIHTVSSKSNKAIGAQSKRTRGKKTRGEKDPEESDASHHDASSKDDDSDNEEDPGVTDVKRKKMEKISKKKVSGGNRKQIKKKAT